jgi:hypothetical protein
MEYNAEKILSGQFAKMRLEKSGIKLVLHTETRPLRRWIAAASGIAAAAIVAVAVLTTSERSHSGDIICYVNGVHITDPGEIEAYTREALEIAGENLRRPGETLVLELGSDPVMERVGEMLNELTKTK